MRQRSEAQDRLRWLLHDIEPGLHVPLGPWIARSGLSGSHGASRAQTRASRCGSHVTSCAAAKRSREANEFEREVAGLVANYSPQLLRLKGCGALIAAKTIGETGGIGRFRSDTQFASLAGVAPVQASSGQQRRH